MKTRSIIANSVLAFALLAGGTSVFAEEVSQSSTNIASSAKSEIGVQVNSYEWRGQKTFYGQKPPQSTTHNDGRGYIGTVYLQPGSEFLLDPANNVWTGNYVGMLYYQY